MEYLGHKAGLLAPVLQEIEGGAARPLSVLDAFSGTSIVAAALRHRGHRVHANDHLALCGAWARAALLVPSNPRFADVGPPRRTSEQPYLDVLERLNGLAPVDGFVTRHFSPASMAHDGVERRYFTVENARRIDAVRYQILAWRDRLTPGEEGLLLSTLVGAAMDVSNTAGTYGCYLKQWKAKALQPFHLRPLTLPTNDDVDHLVTTDDAVIAAAEADVDVVYADPPYTKRQYAAYYHVLETLVRADEPRLVGLTGLRNWQSHASDWCYRRKAPAALDAIVTKSSAPRFVLSYSEDGQIEHDTVMETLAAHGSVSAREIEQRRYRSSSLPHKGRYVAERIYSLVKS